MHCRRVSSLPHCTHTHASPALQVHASFHAQERSVTMAWQQFMELGHLRTCLADLTTILRACCVQTDQLMLTRNPVKVEGRLLGCTL